MPPVMELDLELLRIAALLERDPARAARAAAEIVRSHPGHVAATMLLGSAQHSAGNPDAAIAAFAEVAALQPDSAATRFELGRALRAAGRDAEALGALQEALRLAPDFAPAWREISALQADRGDPIECDAAYARYLKLAPGEPGLREAEEALAAERFDAAGKLLQRALAGSPHNVAALRMRAEIAVAREDYPEAEALLERCLQLAPGYGRARLELVEVLLRQAKGAAMLPLLERLLAGDRQNLRYRTLQAAAYRLLGDSERAVRILSTLVAEVPQQEHVWLNYGHVLRSTGHPAEAIAAFRRSAELNPAQGRAWMALANLKTYRFTPSETAAMERQLERSELRGIQRVQFEFALGKAREDAGEYGASFQHYARGNALRRAMLQYRPERVTRLVERSRDLYTPAFFAARAGWGAVAADPIFIVGLPRSGSTLLEQILASHPEIEGTDELADVPRFALELGDRDAEPGKPSDYPAAVAQLTREQLTALGERYLAQTRIQRRLGRRFFIDKMGGNFMHVGLIHLMLPNARIIDMRRAPLACCFANFKHLFELGMWFSYSFEDISHYYRDYVSLMAHFDAVFPGRIHRVRYESLVANLEGEVRALLDYCGLPYAQQCLRFYETRRTVQTVSSEQVRQPVYTDGVAQWRNFEPWLGPLREALGDLAGP